MTVIRLFNKMTKDVKRHYSTKVAPKIENIKTKTDSIDAFPFFLKKGDKVYQRQGNFFEGETLIYAYYEVDLNDIKDIKDLM